MRCSAVAPMLALALLPLSLGAQSADSALTVHGYVTQGAARSTALAIWGIPAHDVTTDYRSAVIQFRYAMSKNNSLTLQLGHRRYGTSALNTTDGATTVDVAYVQHRSTRYGTLSLGRTQIPFGIYSGIRDLGVLLPFYRAPGTYYAEGFRALDGAQWTRTTRLASEWWLESTGFLGGMDVKSLVRLPNKPEFAVTTRVERAYGTHVTLSTPVEGLELSGHAARFRDLDAGNGATPSWYSAAGGSLNFTRSYGFVRSEARQFRTVATREAQRYVQLTVKPVGGLSLNGQSEAYDTHVIALGRTIHSFRDNAASLGYAFGAGLVASIETHAAKGYQFFNVLVPAAGSPAYTHYLVARVSASF